MSHPISTPSTQITRPLGRPRGSHAGYARHAGSKIGITTKLFSLQESLQTIKGAEVGAVFGKIRGNALKLKILGSEDLIILVESIETMIDKSAVHIFLGRGNIKIFPTFIAKCTNGDWPVLRVSPF